MCIRDRKKEISKEAVVFSINEIKKKSWGVIKVAKAVLSTGDIESDFQSAWTVLSATPFKITDLPATTETFEGDGWKMKSGSGRCV